MCLCIHVYMCIYICIHMCVYASCFLIHSATLYLLVGMFKPLTFKVILDRYTFSAIFLLYYFPPFFLSLSFSFSFYSS